MATTSAAARRAQQKDSIAEVLDAQIARTGERVQSAQRSLERYRAEYAQLIAARGDLREL